MRQRRPALVEAAARPKVIVTGAAGFVGFHVTKALLAGGAEVTGVDSLNDYYDVTLKHARLAEIADDSGFRFHHLELENHEAILTLFETVKPDIVIHLAAQAGVRYSLSQPRKYTSSNIDGFLSILEAARTHPVEHLIYASSSSVYGVNEKVPFHENDPVDRPVSLYAATKRANELMAQTYAHLYRIPLSGLRFFTAYGPWGRPDMAYFSFTDAILKGLTIDVYNNGIMRRDFTYIDDIVEAIIRLVPLAPKTDSPLVLNHAPHILYNIGNHTPIELSAFIETIEKAVGRSAIKRYLPMQAGDVPATYADVERISKATGFAPKTSLAVGIEQFVKWYCDYYRV